MKKIYCLNLGNCPYRFLCFEETESGYKADRFETRPNGAIELYQKNSYIDNLFRDVAKGEKVVINGHEFYVNPPKREDLEEGEIVAAAKSFKPKNWK